MSFRVGNVATDIDVAVGPGEAVQCDTPHGSRGTVTLIEYFFPDSCTDEATRVAFVALQEPLAEVPSCQGGRLRDSMY